MSRSKDKQTELILGLIGGLIKGVKK